LEEGATAVLAAPTVAMAESHVGEAGLVTEITVTIVTTTFITMTMAMGMMTTLMAMMTTTGDMVEDTVIALNPGFTQDVVTAYLVVIVGMNVTEDTVMMVRFLLFRFNLIICITL